MATGKQGKGASAPRRSPCPIAATLDLVGDKWSLILLRDLTIGKRRYSEFLASPEHITTNILAERLKRLEEEGLVTRRPYQTRPTRHEYALTRKGAALIPVMQAICRFANEQIPGTWTPPETFMKLKPK